MLFLPPLVPLPLLTTPNSLATIHNSIYNPEHLDSFVTWAEQYNAAPWREVLARLKETTISDVGEKRVRYQTDALRA